MMTDDDDDEDSFDQEEDLGRTGSLEEQDLDDGSGSSIGRRGGPHPAASVSSSSTRSIASMSMTGSIKGPMSIRRKSIMDVSMPAGEKQSLVRSSHVTIDRHSILILRHRAVQTC